MNLSRVPRHNKFLCGSNIPWISFARDIVDFPEQSEITMKRAMDEIRMAGGNAMRWWLHTNGRHSPTFINGKVAGLHENTIPILKRVLTMAAERQLVISMCLWSFDMLQHSQGQDVVAMKNLLEHAIYTNYYIENALIPMLCEIGTHPSIMTWEIFNEPEGMVHNIGWSQTRTSIDAVQQTTSLIASAIHKYAPGVPVSNGSWNISVLSDVGKFHNYYRDDRLMRAGRNEDGYLDFYQVHFYPDNFDNAYSPFHYPAAFWNTNKPLLIGEFPNIGCRHGKVVPKRTTEECLKYALDGGYAGCLTWRWPEEPGMGSFLVDAQPAIISLHNLI